MRERDFARFQRNIDVDASGCWLWNRCLDAYGYACLPIMVDGKAKYPKAHRLAYEHYVGPIPAGLVIDHLCRVRHCVNPDHLEPVTNRENLLRGENFVARQARRTHCSRGHEYTPDNTATYNGCRTCRACWKSRRAERRLDEAAPR